MAQLQCSFCGKQNDQVEQLIAGPGVYICNECVDLCQEILAGGGGGQRRQASPDDAHGRWSHDQATPHGLTEEDLRGGLDVLSYRERRVLELRYGLHGETPRTIEQIAATFGVTPEKIRHIETTSLKKLQSRAGPRP